MSYKDFQKRIITIIDNDYILNYNNHTFDNSFMEVNSYEMWQHMNKDGLKIIGISFNPPYGHYSYKDVAFVFKDIDNEIFWIHLTRISWEHYVLSAFGKEEGDKIITEIYNKYKV